MARVYLARDLRHDRDVAIKVVNPELAVGGAEERFLREIRLCARLTHPHILPVLDSGSAGGRLFYVMPFVDGESVRERLKRERKLPVETAVALVHALADALDFAHAAGVLHRDIKPENILVRGEQPILLDFGVGRALSGTDTEDATLTMTGMVVGTPAYMSPGQAAGEVDLDGRSDQYSLATVLYELLAGEVPFAGPTMQATIARRFFEHAPPLDTRRADTPSHVVEAVARALARDPGDRFPTAGEFGRAITTELTPGGTPAFAREPREVRPSIAVLPFANVGGDSDTEILVEGITDEVIAALSRLRTMRVAARTSSYAMRGRADDIATIGRRLGVDTLLEGSVQRSGNRIRVKARHVKADDGFQLWTQQFDRELDDIFAIQDAISSAIAEALAASILGVGDGGARLSVPTTAPAYEQFLRGRFLLNKRTEATVAAAVDSFEAALRLDPDYAPAHAGMADALAVLGMYGARDPRQVMPLAREQALRAAAIDPTRVEPVATLGLIAAVFDRDWDAAEQLFQRAIRLDPSYVAAHQWLAITVLVPRGRFAEARATIARARGLDPLSLVVGATEGLVSALAGDPTGAIAQLRDVLLIEPGFGVAHLFLGQALLDRGDAADALAVLRGAEAIVGPSPELLARLAHAQAATGDQQGAALTAAALRARRASAYAPATQLAEAELAIGDLDAAMRWLELAVDEHDPLVAYIGTKAVWRPLADHARWASLLSAVGVTGVRVS
jgi:eukaryotic-like serine/threonine-protein kinase